MSTLAVLCGLLLGASLIDAQPAIGPFATARTVVDCPALDASSPEIVLTYPSNASASDRFPLIAYAHGMAGGGFDVIGYIDLFHQLASYGFVVAAPKSCTFGCRKPGGASRWSECAGLPRVEPPNDGWDSYYTETLKTIEFSRNNTKEHPFNLIEWHTGVGIAGHSMGGQSTTIAACAKCTQAYDIRAAVLHHAATAYVRGVGNAGVNVSIPTAAFTSSGDAIWNETRQIYEAMDGTKINKMYRNVEGFSHLEPVLWPPIENPFLATYTAAWFKIYLLNELKGEYYNLIYGAGPTSVCKQAKMAECHVPPRE